MGDRSRRRPAFPGSCPPSIIGAGELNYCVRDGNRCGLSAIATGMVLLVFFVNCRVARFTRSPCALHFAKNSSQLVRPVFSVPCPARKILRRLLKVPWAPKGSDIPSKPNNENFRHKFLFFTFEPMVQVIDLLVPVS